MLLIGIPIPKNMRTKLEAWLEKNTEEIHDKEG